MKQTYTPEQVRRCCIAYANGQSVSELAEILGIPRSTIYTWIKREQQQQEESKKEEQQQEESKMKEEQLLK